MRFTHLLLTLAFLLALVSGGTLRAQDYCNGNFGEGHRRYHNFYQQFFTTLGKSCCNKDECRPTCAERQADGSYVVMVDGMPCPVQSQDITTHPMNLPHRIHVCASQTSVEQRKRGECPAIHCTIMGEIKM